MNILHAPIEVGDRCAEMLKATPDATGKVAPIIPAPLRHSCVVNRWSATVPQRKEFGDDWDMLHFHCGASMINNCEDVEWAASANIPMVMHFWGSDVRDTERAGRINPVARSLNHKANGIRSHLDYLGKHIRHAIIPNYEVGLYVSEHFENVHVLPHMLDLTKIAERCLLCKQIKVACQCKPDAPPHVNRGQDNVVVVHVCTNEYLKGTRAIQEACAVVGKKVGIELRVVRALTREQTLDAMSQADLVIDSLHRGTVGRVTLEAMALGKPVVTWVCDEMRRPIHYGHHEEPPPFFIANETNISECLDTVFCNAEMMFDVNKKARAYVEKYHDITEQITKLTDIYKQAINHCPTKKGSENDNSTA